MVKYSLNGPDATARQFRSLRKDQSENAAAISGAINPVLQYLTGGDGIAQSNLLWYMNSSQATTDYNPQPAPYDPGHDKDVSIVVPKSGKVLLTTQAWISVKVNAYSPDNPVSVNARTGVLPVLWYDGQEVPELQPGSFGGCQLLASVWGINNSQQLGMSLSTTKYFSDLAVGERLNFRSRRFYWGWAQNATGGKIPLPQGSWYSMSIGTMTIQVMPVYSGGQGD